MGNRLIMSDSIEKGQKITPKSRKTAQHPDISTLFVWVIYYMPLGTIIPHINPSIGQYSITSSNYVGAYFPSSGITKDQFIASSVFLFARIVYRTPSFGAIILNVPVLADTAVIPA